MDRFHTTCPGKLTKIKWHKRIPDTAEVSSRANMPSIQTLLEKAPARWAGHVLRVNDQRILNVLVYGNLTQGKLAQIWTIEASLQRQPQDDPK